VTVVELGLYALLLAAAATAVWRRPLVALYLFVVGLALHNAVMAALYAAGVRGSTLTAITAWKEILLAVALAHVGIEAWRARRLPFRFARGSGLRSPVNTFRTRCSWTDWTSAVSRTSRDSSMAFTG